MDSLYIVLIVAGVAVFVGLVLWARGRRARHETGSPALPDPLDQFEVGGFTATQPTAESWDGPGFTAGDEAVVAEEEPAIPILDAVVEHADEPAGHHAPAPDGDVLVLTVIADEPKPLRDVVDALVLAGFVHGRMGIFHYYPDAEGVGGEPWFSAANVLEPGTFDLDALDGAMTPGVAIFAQLPAATEGEVVWEQMLAAARTIAGKLDARLCDERRQPLADSRIAALAERAQRFSAAPAARRRA